MKIAHLTVFSLIVLASLSAAHSEPTDGMEKGRVKVCKGQNSLHPEYLQTVDIPIGATFTIPADTAGSDAAISITQTNFPKIANEKSDGEIRIPDGYTVKIEKENGVSIAKIDLTDKNCVYLDALAQASPSKGPTSTERNVSPDWNISPSKDVMPTSYRYFAPLDPTYYIASNVGKNLQYVIHDTATGSYVNHDKVMNVPVVNEQIKSSVAYSFRKNLRSLNQFDINTLNFEQLGVDVQANDLKDSEKLNTLITQFKKNVRPQPNSRLVLIVPMRQPIKVVFSNATIYGSKVEGLGFYVDYRLGTESFQSGSATGAFDAFFNCQVAVVDVDSGKLIAVRDYAGGHVFSAARSPNGNVFESLNGFEMINAIDAIADEGAAKLLSGIIVSKQ